MDAVTMQSMTLDSLQSTGCRNVLSRLITLSPSVVVSQVCGYHKFHGSVLGSYDYLGDEVALI